MVVAQLVEWSLPAPEVRGLNPIIDIGRYSTKCNLEMSKMKEIEVGEAHLKKLNLVSPELSSEQLGSDSFEQKSPSV